MQNFKNCLCRIRDLQHQIASFEKELETQFGVSLNEGMVFNIFGRKPDLRCNCPNVGNYPFQLFKSDLQSGVKGFDFKDFG